MSSNLIFKKNCEFCGNEFEAKTLFTRYCSHTCNRKHYKKLKREKEIQSVKAENTIPDQEPKNINLGIQLKEFLSVEETATLLGASRSTIQRLITKGSIKIAKLGRRTIVKRTEIDKLFI
ncbi:MAG: helix-turn-helix domain-containing protein [Bacteroidales bacterium]